MTEDPYPLYPTAVALPILAFPAWILCIPPMVWHFLQRNIAAGSLILWMSFLNFFTFINALIWPRDNVNDWWEGGVLCDIQARIQVGAVVALTSCTALIARRLAKVMDTRNITVSKSRNSNIKEKALEIVCCWVYPFVMMAVYYVVQPARYFIFGISGCVAAFDTSWPSIVLVWMWGPITTFVAAYYAGLLIFRSCRYRREFHRLISANRTTKSRFMRLFILSVLFIMIFIPYDLFILYELASTINGPFVWNVVHGPTWNTVVKVPSLGVVRFDRWGEIATGYLFFILFGTGTDAHNTYKSMLRAMGLGKIFPSLYEMRESGRATPSTSTSRGWASSWSSKAKHFFSKNDSVSESSTAMRSADTGDAPVAHETTSSSHSEHLQPTPTNDPILRRGSQDVRSRSNNTSFFDRVFTRRNNAAPVPPLSTTGQMREQSLFEKSSPSSIGPGVYARAWASNTPDMHHADESDEVHVVHEVRQDYQAKGKEKKTDPGAWV